jgi:gliding motility-associated transport system permease protein
MRTVWAITKKELEQYFASPVAYAVVTFFLVLCSIFFYIYLTFYVQNSAMAGQMGGGENMEVTQSVIRPFLANVSFFFVLILPMLTMRQFAEEKKLGTYELLSTSPVTVPQLVLGKYLGVISFIVCILVLSAIYPAILAIFGKPDFGPILTGYLGLLLLGAAILAVGIFFSSVTESQIIAVVLSFVFLLVFWIINWLSRSEAWYGKLLQYVSIFQRFDEFTKGVLNLNDAFYFISFAFFALFATGIVLQSQRWKS